MATPKPLETLFLLTISNHQPTELKKPGFLPQTLIAQNSSNPQADKLLQEGLQLFQQGTAESLRAALEKWEAARQLYRAAGDKGKEAVMLIALPKNGTGQVHNIVVRGLGNTALAVHSQARLTEGKMFRSGSNEIVVGSALEGHFQGLEIGSSIRFGQRDWLVVGRIDAGGSGFDSEIWLDSEQLMQTFRRNAYSSVVVRLSDPAYLDQVKSKISSDPRLTLEVKSERSFYEDQSRVLSGFIRFLGITLSLMFSLGAIIGATITMYASVANRKLEIGVMRALGFRRENILFAFLTESILLGLFGGRAGMGLASLMMLVKITTLNWTSYSELAFQFILTPTIVLQSLVFSLVMGLIGGFLPAIRAANLNIVAALRAH
jgi:ABC-type antimicrobial peptide transport system permease subunit